MADEAERFSLGQERLQLDPERTNNLEQDKECLFIMTFIRFNRRSWGRVCNIREPSSAL